jgi:hypothetical protein
LNGIPFTRCRRLFAVLGKHLPDTEVAKAGGWRDLHVMKRSYQRPGAAGVLRVVENAGSGRSLDTPPEPSRASAKR